MRMETKVTEEANYNKVTDADSIDELNDSLPQKHSSQHGKSNMDGGSNVDLHL